MSKPRKIPITTLLEPCDLEKLERVAKREEKPLSAVIRAVIKRGLKVNSEVN